eukprot:gb/GEZN01009927.1/.p1 GENE.gb/GEZN01009927.1/~~gb/GEZN01009927.1/.p1  ORF type:complete len:302 (-),score=50.57 gb/GEZN01009927.1/:209-1114(-)
MSEVKNGGSVEGQADIKREPLGDDPTTPPGMDNHHWLAFHTPALIELFRQLKNQIKTLCTERTCPKMKAGKFEYQWKHHFRSKKPKSYPVPYYMKLVEEWLKEQDRILSMELWRYDNMKKKMEEKGEIAHPDAVAKALEAERQKYVIGFYKYEPMKIIGGMWSKVFSVFAHIRLKHWQGNELSDEIKQFIQTSFERLMLYVQYHDILTENRLAPLKDEIAELNLKLPPKPASDGKSGSLGGSDSRIRQPTYSAENSTTEGGKLHLMPGAVTEDGEDEEVGQEVEMPDPVGGINRDAGDGED